MFKFFRNLRMKLITNNKFKQYVIYALGEIFLVVIGILLALQLNNWNEGQKNSLKKQNLLKSLKIEFQDNLKQLDTVLNYMELVKTSCYESLALIREQPKQIKKASLDKLMDNLSNIWTFDSNNGALRSGVSSGDIHLLKNDSLLNLLFSWEDLAGDLDEEQLILNNHEIESRQFLSQYLRYVDLYRHWLDLKDASYFESDYVGLIDDPQFENYIALRLSYVDITLFEMYTLQKVNLNILQLIRQELSK